MTLGQNIITTWLVILLHCCKRAWGTAAVEVAYSNTSSNERFPACSSNHCLYSWSNHTCDTKNVAKKLILGVVYLENGFSGWLPGVTHSLHSNVQLAFSLQLITPVTFQKYFYCAQFSKLCVKPCKRKTDFRYAVCTVQSILRAVNKISSCWW